MENFNIPPDHIYSSRDASFLPALLASTNGYGVDVVLNSLTGDLLHDSLRVLAPFGRFVELGKKDIVESGRLPLENFKENLAFIAFDLLSIYYSKHERHHKLWQAYVLDFHLLPRYKFANYSV